MYEREKAIIITNNDRVFEAYKDEMQVILKQTYEEVLIATRDMVYDRHILLTHPQTPYRSVIVYPGSGEDAMKAILLIEKCLEVYRRWQEIAPSPASYPKKVEDDFKTIDLSIVQNVMPRIV